MNQQIVKYLQQNKDQYSKKDLMEQLKTTGYMNSDIVEAVAFVYDNKQNGDLPVPPAAPSKSSAQITEGLMPPQAPNNFVEEIIAGFKNNFRDDIDLPLEHKILLVSLSVKTFLFLIGYLRIASVIGLFSAKLGGVSVLPYDVLYIMPFIGVLFFKKWSYKLALGIAGYSLLATIVSLIVPASLVVISVNSGNSVTEAVGIVFSIIFDTAVLYATIRVLMHLQSKNKKISNK